MGWLGHSRGGRSRGHGFRGMCGRGIRFGRWRIPSFHLHDVGKEVIEGGVVCQDEILVDRQSEQVPDFGHDFGLLHGINAEFAFQILVHLDEISRVTGVFDHNLDQGRSGFRVASDGCRHPRCGCGWFSRRLFTLPRFGAARCSRSRGGKRDRCAALHSLDVSHHVIEGWMVGKHEIFVHGQSKAVANVRHDFGLLDGVNAEFALQILVQLDEICGIARVVDHNFHHNCLHGGIVNRCQGTGSRACRCRCRRRWCNRRWSRCRRGHFKWDRG